MNYAVLPLFQLDQFRVLLPEAHEPREALVRLLCLTGGDAHPHGPAQQGRGSIRHRLKDLRLVDEVPSIDEFYYDLTGEQESDLRVYWQDNTLRIVSESPGEVTLHLKDLRDTYQFPAGGCVITDFADGKIIVK